MSLEREQQDLNNAKYAKDLRDNPLMQAMFTYLKASYVDKLTKIKKGPHYEAQLTDVHDSLQNLARIEGYIQKCINDGRIVEEKQVRKQSNKD